MTQFKLSTFHTMNLETLATAVFEEGWNYVCGTRYTKDGIEGDLVMHDGYYSIEQTI